MTLHEAIDEARRRWGPDGTAWGISPRLCVGVATHDFLLEPPQICQGMGDTWESAFANAQPHRGHFHTKLESSDRVLCYGNCGEIETDAVRRQLPADESL